MNKELIKKFAANDVSIGSAFCETLLERYEHFKAIEESKVSVPDVADWEILEFRGKILTPFKAIKKPYGWVIDPFGAIERDVNFFLNRPEEWNIHSVKRCSDGEVFTVGDRIMCYENEDFVLRAVEITGNKMLCISTLSETPLSEIKHVPKEERKPLFKTSDGVDVFEGDTCYYVGVKSLNIDTWEHIPAQVQKGHFTDYIYFSTKQMAKDYILHKKPVLCYDDVIDNVGISRVTSLDRLYELVKQRIAL